MDIERLFPKINPDDLFPKIDAARLFTRKSNEVPIGTDLDAQGRAYLDLGLLNTHLHVIGLTGTGKSCFLELLCRQILSLNHGLTLIDPHGFLYDAMLAYISHHPELAEKVILFNPTNVAEQMLVGFNPMQLASYYHDLSKQVDINVEGIAKVWGDDSDKTPRLKRQLGNTMYPLIEGGYTLLEAEYFTRLGQPEIRHALAQETSLRRVKAEWADMARLPIREQEHLLESMMNRLPRFIDNQMIRLTLGQTKKVLDFEDIFENKKTLLVNLSTRGALSRENSNLIGVFLVNELFHYAVSRTQEAGKKNPMFLMIDEFQNFLSPDTAAIIDECRKFGLHGIFSHQRLQQLLDKGDNIYFAVKDGITNKMMFALNFADANMLVDPAYAQIGGLDLKQVKQEIYGSTVWNYEEETRINKSLSRGTSQTDATMSSSGGATGSATGEAAGQTSTPDGLIFAGMQQSSSSSMSNFQSAMDSWSEGTAHAVTEGESESETEVHVMKPLIRQELKSREFFSLEEQRYKAAVGFVRQMTQQAVLVLRGSMKRVKIETLFPYPEKKEKLNQTKVISYKEQSRYYLPREKRQEEVDKRQRDLEAIVEPQKPLPGQKPKIRVEKHKD